MQELNWTLSINCARVKTTNCSPSKKRSPLVDKLQNHDIDTEQIQRTPGKGTISTFPANPFNAIVEDSLSPATAPDTEGGWNGKRLSGGFCVAVLPYSIHFSL